MTTDRKPLSQAIADAADLIDCVAQREAYRQATELIGPALRGVDGRMPAGAMDGWTAEPRAVG
ncbi:hypothetical protein M5E06_10370 [Azospirillum sp. A1-3]|uniref:hypothetical protein n=1 Tax=Azospirillum sp. A1-3 TaxID=185874 RepID=UPI0020770BAB|nr:hypothetical protein [Azospirillum sp. A1-3]MCM8734598.1 hypothetical protein [Azospirillum sp. A1-3]